MERKLKILVALSGGKDSLATLLWTIKESGFKKENIEAIFCDTGWEHEFTYKHVKYVCEKLDVRLVTLKSKKVTGILDLAKKRQRFPSSKARFCTEELKTIPMIDYILDQCTDVIVMQGIRHQESSKRKEMTKHCTFFRYYFEPYGHDKKGEPKYHKYRRKDVFAHVEKYLADIQRPVIQWSAQEVINYCLEQGIKPNPLYYHGFSRVGCFPCIMIPLDQIALMEDFDPKRLDLLEEYEKEIGSTFFPPDKIPPRYRTLWDPKSKKYVSTMGDVRRYIYESRRKQLSMFEKEEDTSCMSYYGICE